MVVVVILKHHIWTNDLLQQDVVRKTVNHIMPIPSGAQQNDVNARIVCREIIVLPGACIWSIDTYFSLLPILIISIVYDIMQKFHTKQDFVLKYHILQFYSHC